MEGQPNSFTERFAKSAEARIEADKIKNTHDNAVDLVKNNVDFFGGDNDEKKSEIALRVLGRFGRGYADVVSIIEATNNPSKNQRIAHGDLDSLAESVRIAMDMSVLGGDLVTDSMTAEQIDENLSIELKGIGERIKEKRLLDNVATTLIEKNNVIEDDNLFTTQDKVVRGEVYRKWGEEVKTMPENSYVRKYMEVARSVFEDLGVQDNFNGRGDNLGRRSRMVPRMDAEGNIEGYESQYEPSYDGFVSGLKFMENRMTLRYNDYLKMSWYEGLTKHEMDKLAIAMMMSEVANGLKGAGKDLEAIMKNKQIFGFLNEHMSTLFDDDFKLVTSHMLNDLCTLGVDSNGKKCLRYKENGLKIDDDVKDKLNHIHRTEDEWADWLAQQNGRTKASNMDKLNAYTAWNMFFGLGDSSMADRLRSLPTWEGVISDALRTLNPEYKALAKWQILKSGTEKTDQDLIGFEYFGAEADELKKRLAMERDLGHALVKGDKTLRQKILDGDVSFLSHKMFYGFLDFFNGDRDLYRGSDSKTGENYYNKKTKEGENFSAAQLLMDYAYRDKIDEKGNKTREFINEKENRGEFTFGDAQVTFMNEFRDSLEGATMAYYCLTGKVKVDSKDAKAWVNELKSKLGMVSDLKFSNVPVFTYGRDPLFWRDILVSVYGGDPRRISTDYIAIPRVETTYDKKHKLDPEKIPYNLNLLDLITNDLQITDNDIDVNELLRLLGVKINKGERPNRVTTKNELFEFSERTRTGSLLAERNKKMEYDVIKDIYKENNDNLRTLVENVDKLRSNNPEFAILKRNFDRTVKARSYKNAEKIYQEMVDMVANEE